MTRALWLTAQNQGYQAGKFVVKFDEENQELCDAIKNEITKKEKAENECEKLNSLINAKDREKTINDQQLIKRISNQKI